ncbi:sulfurtransferase [Kurthia senegalensis]|uniref:sulfurtransferase n=1 Tax=Kurthia senegalensis TaxID=1033740 RepID=UPI000288630C|nr:rhodanese-like domain-containing protein [Kurthia senegalensis]
MSVFISAKDVQKRGHFIDARFDLANRDYGKQQFANGHIEKAIYWDIEDDLSDMQSTNGRHPMPTKEQLEVLYHQSGLTYDQPIYVYDEGGQPFAARAYFILVYGGFKQVKIVREGYEGLREAGFSTTKDELVEQTAMPIQWDESVYVDRAYVKEVVDGKRMNVLLDARAAARYRGDFEPIDHIAGHIPTARNFDWEQLIQNNELRENAAIKATVSQDESIIVYCGSGVTASPLFAMLKEMDYPNVQLYMGSFSDWSLHEEVARVTNDEETL